MEVIDKISNSRIILKEILEDEWNTTNIPVLSKKDIEELFPLKSIKNNILNILGNGGRCSFSLDHKIVPEHRLHIFYYNFPELGKNTSKTTKSIINKINQIYDTYINKTDNILIIINEPVGDNIHNMIDNININNLKSSYNTSYSDDFSSIISKFKDNNIHLNNKHFRNVHILSINSLQVNLLKHDYVPTHKCIRDENKINEILKLCNCKSHQLPIISKNDIISRLYLSSIGDIIEITRISKKSGEYKYYRICK